jgi:hypothetical protein
VFFVVVFPNQFSQGVFPMTKKILRSVFVLFVSMIISIPFFVGRDGITAAITTFIKGKKIQIEEDLNGKIVLERLIVKRDDTKKIRAALKEIADKLMLDAEVKLREVKRFEDKQAEIKNSFEWLQDIAKQAGLPKHFEATSDDMKKQITVGMGTLSGKEVYRQLKKFKSDLQKANVQITDGRKLSEFEKEQADLIEDDLSQIDDNIAKIEQRIEKIKIQKEVVTVNKKIKSLGLNGDRMTELLNTDNIIAESDRVIDKGEIIIKNWSDEKKILKAFEAIRSKGGKDDSITGDDLI